VWFFPPIGGIPAMNPDLNLTRPKSVFIRVYPWPSPAPRESLIGTSRTPRLNPDLRLTRTKSVFFCVYLWPS